MLDIFKSSRSKLNWMNFERLLPRSTSFSTKTNEKQYFETISKNQNHFCSNYPIPLCRAASSTLRNAETPKNRTLQQQQKTTTVPADCWQLTDGKLSRCTNLVYTTRQARSSIVYSQLSRTDRQGKLAYVWRRKSLTVKVWRKTDHVRAWRVKFEACNVVRETSWSFAPWECGWTDWIWKRRICGMRN